MLSDLIAATEEELKNSKGVVYGIRSRTTGMWYVGQTLRSFNARYPGGEFWRFASNPYLRRTYAKYGRNDFEIYLFVKDVSSPSVLDEMEKEMIIKCSALHPTGYNFESGGQRYGKRVNQETKRQMSETWLDKKSKRRVLYDENEIRHVFYNISTFAAKNGLDPRVLHALTVGKIKRYNGWHKKGTNLKRPFKHSKRYCLIGPDGKKHVFYNMIEFARKHGLIGCCLYQVASGRQIVHKGFHLPKPRDKKPNSWAGNPNNPKRKYAKIVLKKEGQKFVITDDILEFCKTHGISKREIYTLTSGDQKTAKGFQMVEFEYTEKHKEKLKNHKLKL